MRIIAGVRRGHKLFDFVGGDVRPTTDRVKESMFNLIQMHFPCNSVLDLFGGSGALTFESISRGTNKAVCIDIDPRSIELIKKNASYLKFDQCVDIIHMDHMKYLDTTTHQFDIIFLDPPYNKGFVLPVLEKIVKQNLLTDTGIIVLESDNTDEHSEVNGLSILKQKRYGRTYVTVYHKGVTT